MADDVAVAFGAALLGAGVGGLASSAGSIWVARRELARAARLRMYKELLPDLPAARARGERTSMRRYAGRSDGSSPSEVLAALHREAVLAGRRDVRLADAVLVAWADLVRPRQSDSRTDEEGIPITAKRHAEEAAFDAALSALSAHLADKIR